MLSLLFGQGQRPDFGALDTLSRDGGGSLHFSISHQPDPDEGWLELLASGLTFDCRGLAPAPPQPVPPPGALLGLAEAPVGEAVSLSPGPHLLEGGGLLPVVRILVGLGAAMASLPGLRAVVWHPARSWMVPDYFRSIASTWLGGGAFPALGLTTLERHGASGMTSFGLALFTGQELRLEGMAGLAPGAMARIAMRLVHELVLEGPLLEPRDYVGPGGELLHAAPDGRFVSVRLDG
ncbi:MAG: hypothetical protein RL702_797 [Pseudomonadota bacterium]